MTRAQTCALSLVAAFALLTPYELRAAELIAFADVFPGINSPDTVPFPADGSFGQASAAANIASTFGSTDFVGSASAQASFGQLSAFASATGTNYAPQSFAQPCPQDPTIACSRLPAGADAGFSDTLLFTGGSGDAFLALGWDITGAAQSSSTGGIASFNVDALGRLNMWSGSTRNAPDFQTQFRGPTSFVGSVPFTFGVPFTMTTFLSAEIDAFDFSATSNYDFSGVAGFADTAKLVSFRVFSDEALQNEIRSFGVDAESATDYRGFNVPEPGTIALVLAGTIVLLNRRRRRMHR